MRCVLLLITCGLLAACVPATLPPQLSHTPGPPVVLSDNTYRSTAFVVDYPAGWRVVTSATGDPLSVVFVAPDDSALIVVSEQPITPPQQTTIPPEDLHLIQTTTTLSDGSAVYALLMVGDSQSEALPIFDTMVESLTAPAN